MLVRSLYSSSCFVIPKLGVCTRLLSSVQEKDVVCKEALLKRVDRAYRRMENSYCSWEESS